MSSLLQHSTKTLLRTSCRGTLSQVRYHHPDPFNPKMTKGWKAAVKVRTMERLDFFAAKRNEF